MGEIGWRGWDTFASFLVKILRQSKNEAANKLRLVAPFANPNNFDSPYFCSVSSSACGRVKWEERRRVRVRECERGKKGEINKPQKLESPHFFYLMCCAAARRRERRIERIENRIEENGAEEE
jgi:hypothetical protein